MWGRDPGVLLLCSRRLLAEVWGGEGRSHWGRFPGKWPCSDVTWKRSTAHSPGRRGWAVPRAGWLQSRVPRRTGSWSLVLGDLTCCREQDRVWGC